TSQPVSPTSTLTYTLTATNATGSSTATATVTVTPVADTQPPSVPTGLVASNLSATGLTLTWTASTDNVAVTGYRVYRGGAQIATPTGTTFADTGLTANTLYNYTVAAVDAVGNVSAQSAVRSVTTLTVGPADTAPPSVPSGLAATNVAATTLTLSWTASTDNVGVTGYRVYRGGTLLNTVTSGLSYSVTGLTASTAYSFTVVAFDAAGNVSAQSAALNVSTTLALGEILDESDNVFSILD
ncbi:MAG: fibronectin type III domain-containing protein, partial [Holophaga sp.]|nr:fibronectin type III domain-containing protein [Holophaga sp.]